MEFLKKKLFGGMGLKTKKNSKTPSIMEFLKKKSVWGERAYKQKKYNTFQKINILKKRLFGGKGLENVVRGKGLKN